MTSFSSLLEKLSGCGIAGAPVKRSLRETAQAVEDGDDDVSYTPWPVTTQPWQASHVRVESHPIRQESTVVRGEKKLPLPKRAVQTTTCCFSDGEFDEDSGRKERSDQSEPEPVNALRRSAVSIRLNEDELTLVRRRAAESGISVSEYVRSCVVEADVLRVQVKQVVAEMRSQPTVTLGQEAPRKHAPVPDSSPGKASFSGFWSRWWSNLLGTRETIPMNLQSSGSSFHYS